MLKMGCYFKSIFVLTVVMLFSQVLCIKRDGVLSSSRRNFSHIWNNEELVVKNTENFVDNTTSSSNLFSVGRKGGKGGGMAQAMMQAFLGMCQHAIPMMAMGMMGWMKDFMMMAAGAMMMMMYDQLKNKGEQKKIIIKLPPQAVAPPEPAPQTGGGGGYGPWEG